MKLPQSKTELGAIGRSSLNPSSPKRKIQFEFKNSTSQTREIHYLEDFEAFLQYHVDDNQLPIGKYLCQISNSPFFIVAATGLGKTVAIPIHLFILLCRQLIAEGESLFPLPHIYVVEPTIPICLEEMEHMNQSFQLFLSKKGEQGKDNHNLNPFGAVTGSKTVNREAPILFVTTGVFELIVRDDKMLPKRNRFVIDEAHRILSQSENTEIAVAVAKKRGAIVDFMSATVDTSSLKQDLGVQIIEATESKFPILKVATNVPLEECIGGLAVECLLHPDTAPIPMPEQFDTERDRSDCERVRLHLLSKTSYRDPIDEIEYPGLDERPQGMLVIVNSHRGEQSDTRRIAARLEEAFAHASKRVEILRLASSVVRDADQEKSFRRRVEGIERQNGRFVIVSTNVVEMGVTFPSLDYVVTMDTELETIRASGGEVPQLRPLGVNALFQRSGRVGRRRPGLTFITRETIPNGENPDYSRWTTKQLATNLKLEPIEYAISKGNVRELAFFLFEKGVLKTKDTISDFLAGYSLPSEPQRSHSLMSQLLQQHGLIHKKGLSQDGTCLNDLGRKYRKIGIVQDLDLGKLLAHCCVRERDPNLAIVAATICAAESISFRDFLGTQTYLDEKDPDPALTVRMPITQSDFSKPLGEVFEILKNLRSANEISAIALGTSESMAHHLIELITNKYVVEELQRPKEKGGQNEALLLILNKREVGLDSRSELLSVYNIIRVFFNKFSSELLDPTYTKFELERVRRAIRLDAMEIGLNPSVLLPVLFRIKEVVRRAKLDIRSGRGQKSSISEELLAKALEAQLQLDADYGYLPKNQLLTLLKQLKNKERIAAEFYEHIRQRKQTLLATFREFAIQPISDKIPEMSESQRERFLELPEKLDLFIKCDLERGYDLRGNPLYSCETNLNGMDIIVEIETQKTCIRTSRERFQARGRIVPQVRTNSDGEQKIRYVMSHVTLIPRGNG